MTFYHSRLADELTRMIVSLKLLWFLSNIANSVEMKILHKTTPLSHQLPFFKLLFKMHTFTLMFKTYNKIIDYRIFTQEFARPDHRFDGSIHAEEEHYPLLSNSNL